jgi:predicted GNAT family acetyltransferase
VLELRHFEAVDTFYDRVIDFLCAHEPHHAMLFETCGRLVTHPGESRQPPYLATVEESGEVVAAAVLAPPNPLLLSRAPPEVAPLIAADLHMQLGVLFSVIGPCDVCRAFVDAWHTTSGQPYRHAMTMHVYRLTAVVPVTGVPGALRRATERDRDLIATWVWGPDADDRARRSIEQRLHDPARPLWVWEVDGQSVSMAGQGGATPHGAYVDSVVTPVAYRRRGYASACVAALSQMLLDRGYRFCTLAVDSGNAGASLRYQAVGYEPVCDLDRYGFLTA